jgi:hypothetical protein
MAPQLSRRDDTGGASPIAFALIDRRDGRWSRAVDQPIRDSVGATPIASPVAEPSARLPVVSPTSPSAPPVVVPSTGFPALIVAMLDAGHLVFAAIAAGLLGAVIFWRPGGGV